MNEITGARLEINLESWSNVLDNKVSEYIIHNQLAGLDDAITDIDLKSISVRLTDFYNYLIHYIDYKYILDVLKEWHRLGELGQVALSIKITNDYNASIFMNLMDYLAYNKYIKGK